MQRIVRKVLIWYDLGEGKSHTVEEYGEVQQHSEDTRLHVAQKGNEKVPKSHSGPPDQS